MIALDTSGTMPPRLATFILNRLVPLRDAPLHAALVALTPDHAPAARVRVLAEAVELVGAGLRSGNAADAVPHLEMLPGDEDTGYWARVGMAILIEMRWFREADARGPAPTMEA